MRLLKPYSALLALTAVGAILALAVTPFASSGMTLRVSSGSCKTLDAAATQFRNYIGSIASGTGAEAEEDRSLWSVPATPDSAVVVVADSATCARAAKAHAAQVGADTLNAPDVHVLRVGQSRFIVFNYTKIGEFLAYYVFDEAFNFVDDIMS